MPSFLYTMLFFVQDRVEAVKAREDRGATAVEYALMVALIAIAIIVAVRALGSQLSTLFSNIVTQLGG